MIALANRIAASSPVDDALLGITPAQRRAMVRTDIVETVNDRTAIKAKYDAASDSDEFKNYWANADALDADSAHSKHVRAKLVKRSRYEVGNNGFTDGIVQTHANFVVGTGCKLRMLTQNKEFNETVEREFAAWCKATQFRRKLWCLCHAKVQDGESFGILKSNPKVKHPVKLDMVVFEAEQCQSQHTPFNVPGHIDGIIFDEFGNPEFYEVLKYHPGSQFNTMYELPELVPAKFIVHWYMLRRPGQHRGIPEMKSTMQVGASSRRWREATVSAAENIARFSLFLRTAFQPDEMAQVAPMSTLEIQKGMMTALPAGQDAFQPKAEQPNASYETFNEAQINEQARPKNMPLNIAKCDSSRYNFASGRLDRQVYFGGVDVERQECEECVLEKVFALWYEDAVLRFGWDAPPDEIPPCTFDFPKHPEADLESEAKANDVKLRNGSLTLSQLYANDSEDFFDKLKELAEDYGITEQEARKVLLDTVFYRRYQAYPQNQKQEAGTDA